MRASPQRVPFIAGNWKMHKTLPEARALVEEVLERLGSWEGYSVGFFPPATALEAVVERVQALGGRGPVTVGAQNIHFASEGAFTGEIAASMVRSTGATAVLVGHSERRHIFAESDDATGKKVRAAVDAGLTPLLCVGETLEERDAEETMAVVSRQLRAGLRLLRSAVEIERMVIAYEPVWAIGTGRNATPEQAQEVQAFVRSELSRACAERGGSPEGSQAVRILYGGSVKPENARDILLEPDIDGALVGGASLSAASFIEICRASSPR